MASASGSQGPESSTRYDPGIHSFQHLSSTAFIGVHGTAHAGTIAVGVTGGHSAQ